MAGVHFILEAFDYEQCCPVLQARFWVPDLHALRVVLGEQANDDPELRHCYSLGSAELAAIVAAFGVAFDPAPLGHAEPDIQLYRPVLRSAPYLVHTGYELPLLLDGRKKLARMGDGYPPMQFCGEDRFDHWVAEGRLHREEVVEPFAAPIGRFEGRRTVYYTPKGEEWRIPAMRLIWEAAGKSGGWNDIFERLEGMLFGYEDWQNDWWIEASRRRGGVAGAPLCCAVSAAGLAWIESAGFRALPPCDRPALVITFCDDDNAAAMRAFLAEACDNVALVRFSMGLHQARDILPLEPDTPSPVRWIVPRERIPELNRMLRSPVVIAARRDDPD